MATKRRPRPAAAMTCWAGVLAGLAGMASSAASAGTNGVLAAGGDVQRKLAPEVAAFRKVVRSRDT
ncbi:MAG: hypothetical protein WBF17_06035, partial [Phycisphaerae bacterium]